MNEICGFSSFFICDFSHVTLYKFFELQHFVYHESILCCEILCIRNIIYIQLSDYFIILSNF